MSMRTMKLRTWLKQMKISQGTFARALGIHQGVVSRWASLERIPRAATLVEIARLTKGSVSLKDWT